MHVRVWVYACICVYMCMCTCMSACNYAQCVSMHVWECVSMCVCVSGCGCACVHVGACMCECVKLCSIKLHYHMRINHHHRMAHVKETLYTLSQQQQCKQCLPVKTDCYPVVSAQVTGISGRWTHRCLGWSPRNLFKFSFTASYSSHNRQWLTRYLDLK